jgi:hypothetical protein
MNMEMTSFYEKANDENIFILVIGGGTEAYTIGVKEYMFYGVKGLSCRRKIMNPTNGTIAYPM